MGVKKRSARDAAEWFGPGNVGLDHVTLTDDDLAWLGDVRRLHAWAVKHPPGFYARLPQLEWLTIQGGSGASADFVGGCSRLRCLVLNQILGLSDLSEVATLTQLELLSIYGQPRVARLPDLSDLAQLKRLDLGSLKGLTDGIGPALRAPALEELQLVNSIALAETDAALIRDHPSIREFEWFAPDVPRRLVEPVMRQVGKQKAAPMHPSEWFSSRAASATAVADDLADLPQQSQISAVVEQSGVVWWPIDEAAEAVNQLAESGAVILSLAVRPNEPKPARDVTFWQYGSGLEHDHVAPALKQALTALGEHPALSIFAMPAIGVRWARPRATGAS